VHAQALGHTGHALAGAEHPQLSHDSRQQQVDIVAAVLQKWPQGDVTGAL
jgi:hypothetical protein